LEEPISGIFWMKTSTHKLEAADFCTEVHSNISQKIIIFIVMRTFGLYTTFGSVLGYLNLLQYNSFYLCH